MILRQPFAPGVRFIVRWLTLVVAIMLSNTFLYSSSHAAYCAGVSHMGCFEGIDTSGRSPRALYEAAVEGLREARTPAERELAGRAMKDASNPAMTDQPSAADISEMQKAPKPSSQDAAEKEAVRYFAETLRDPESARYTFASPTKSSMVAGNVHYAGWFMCGTVNSKNAYGGYSGRSMFITWFDPHAADHVIAGLIADDSLLVSGLCHQVYAKGESYR